MIERDDIKVHYLIALVRLMYNIVMALKVHDLIVLYRWWIIIQVNICFF